LATQKHAVPRPNARRLAQALPAPELSGDVPTCRTEPATVLTVTAGAASDGNALVTVSWRGVSIAVPYVASYTPTVGHVVQLLIQGPQKIIWGRVYGMP
jgi:hypothetical protein